MPSPGVVKMALERAGGVKSLCVSDEMAMETAVAFAGQCIPCVIQYRQSYNQNISTDEHKLMVELACAATLVPAYSRTLFEKLVPPHPSGKPRTVVFIVCGGFKVSVAELAEYTRIVAAEKEKADQWDVLCG